MAAKKTVKKNVKKSPSKTAKKVVKKKEIKKKKVKVSKPKKTLKKETPKKKTAAKKKEVKKVVKTTAVKTKTPAKKTAPVKKQIEKRLIVKPRTKPVVSKPKEEEIITPEMVAANRAAALKKIKGYSKKDLDYFRGIILEKRDEILEQLQNLREQMLDPTTGEYINENSPYSLHMAEQGTDAMEREKTFLYAQRENKFLGYLEDALKRIDNGTYGICVECIEEPQHLCPTCPLIPKERLAAVPHSQLCLPMKQKQEKR
ncbi:MAG TPA: conjugal transfer protein TraR [Ignavibacteriaceae bacterium]|jgi:RNA polymerase-binding transcription factor DksA|nr:MAG: RNA polymerase-binding transcription factor DksA [Ignavibacteria bacterium ADurb.Bin266]OQY73876.1 MAG: conjugal transfer protein TraR [Ignavibacteriales bacterium UTCHB2]HQF41968.1 conjugal transfer protein TraR [Ignavibacteriaceae bacterium]HQI41022.1 conjugal transfer protein TraR [Ignavibacteriaceae bacterium]HQJ45391.1 conjugal transfer protein TraR [Ignavibacteriaceae bacterium]